MGLFDAIGDFAGDLFGHGGGGSNPFEAAEPFFRKSESAIKEGYSPYINQGQDAYKILADLFGKSAQDPQSVINEIIGGYKSSPGYQYKLNQGLNTARNAAAAGGYVGNPEDIGHQIDLEGRLLSEDMQNWLNNVLGVRTQGLAGESDFYNKGFQAATGQASDLANLFGAEGSAAVAGEREKKANQQKLFDSLLSLTGFGAGSMDVSKLAGMFL